MELDVFLAPVAKDTPSGVELRNDARFHAIERLIEPAAKENRTATDGSNPDAAVSVDWEDVQGKSAELASEGQDLRLLVIVARSLFHTDGFAGAAAGFDMLRQALSEYWETLHPALRDRPNAQEAALRRINALRQLENDESGLLGDFEYMPAFTMRGLGPITGEDLARGTLTADQVLHEGPSGLGLDEQTALTAAHAETVNRVQAACRALASENAEEITALTEAVSAAAANLAAMEAVLAEKLGSNGSGVSFGELTKFLERVKKSLEGADAAPEEAADEDREEGGAEMATQTDAARPATAQAPPSGGQGTITSRKDVERYLDLIIAFYERTEPSSPIPHLARRMRRMVPMDFVELMEEIAPSGMKEFRSATGATDKSK